MRVLWCLLLFCACTHNPNKIKIAATSVPHAEILREAKRNLKGEVDLQIIEVDDYIVPNRLLDEGQVDANFFQHTPYLALQKERYGYDFCVLATVHVEPLGIYSKRITSLEQLSTGAHVAIPNDPTNEARALLLLQQMGIITLSDQALPTPQEIISNPKKLKFVELDAPLLPRTLDDVSLAVIPSNFALMGKLDLQSALATESSDSPYANVIVVRCGDERKALEKLRNQLKSNEMKKFIREKYRGAIIPASSSDEIPLRNAG